MNGVVVAEAVRFALLGLGVGGLYALAAQGVVLIYRGSGTINFAQGAMGMIGAFVFYELHWQGGGAGGGLATPRWGFWPAFVVGVGVSAGLGVLTYLLVMRPLRKASALARLIGTLGVLTVLQAYGGLKWGGGTILLPTFYPGDVLDLGSDITIGIDRLIVLGVGVALTVTLWVVYRWTRFGLATTAVAENQRGASALGWSPDRIAVMNWGLGAALAGIAGILLIPIVTLSLTNLTNVVFAALAAALVGRFTSFPGTLAAALGIGVAESELGYFAPKWFGLSGSIGLAASVPFLVVIAVLVIRGTSLPVRGFVLERMPALGTGRVRWSALLPALVLAVIAIQFLSRNWVNAITINLIVATIVLSIVVVTGYAGQLSLGQFALAGTGAFIAGRLVSGAGWSFEAALVAGVVGAVPIGLLFALPAVRTRGVNLAIVTFGLGLAVNAIIFNNQSYTGGYEGTVVGKRSLFGLDIHALTHPERYALFCLFFFVLAALAVASVRRSRAGRRLIAVRANERAAAALGVNVVGAKLYAFGLASAIAALGGILLAFRTEQIVYADFNNFNSITYIALAVIGGVGFVTGSPMGAMMASGALGAAFAAEVFAGTDIEKYIPLASGVILIIILLSDPDGLASQSSRSARRLLGFLWRADPVPVPLPHPQRHRVNPVGLHVEDLEVRFGGVIALDGLGLDVEPGQVVGLIGPNGAGKTTAIDAITGFVHPFGGRVRLAETEIGRWSAYRRARAGISRSFQSLELFEDLSVRENLRAASDPRDWHAYFTALVRPADPELQSAAVAAIHEFELEPVLDRKPTELPYGQRRLVGIARAVAVEPSVLLLDEPAAGLSSAESAELAGLVRGLADEWGIAVLVVEHDMAFVMGVCDQIVVLDFGRVIARGTPEEIRADPAVIAAYLGEDVVREQVELNSVPHSHRSG